MSPEQCRGSKSIGDRTDVYSFGVMLYEMLAGQTPFIAEEPGEYIGQHIYKEPPRIGSLVPSIVPALQRLVDSMLLKDPQARPSMAAVARVLKELGNFSSDVVSVRALMEAHAETVPRLRAVPQGNTAKAPDPGPVWSAPTDPLPGGAAGADPPEGPRAPAEVRAAAREGAADSDATQLLAKEAVPGPAADVGPGPGAQPAWQTLNVVRSGAIEKLDVAPPAASAADERRRKPSLTRVLRRSMLQLRRLIFRLLGVSLPVQSGSADALRLLRIRNWMVGIAALLILLLAAALIWRLWFSSADPSLGQHLQPSLGSPGAEPLLARASDGVS
ncbi:MAG: protein kinase [Polyangia bacterium]